MNEKVNTFLSSGLLEKYLLGDEIDVNRNYIFWI